MLLYGKPIAEKIEAELKAKVQSTFWNTKKFGALLFFWDNHSSAVYVRHKQNFGSRIGLSTLVFGQGQENQSLDFPDLNLLLQQTKREKNQIFSLIHDLNQDENCVGIIIQLPLPPELQAYKNDLLSAIAPHKDIDGLWWTMLGKSFFEMLDFTPATAKAVMTLLDYYDLGDVRGKQAAVIGQSTIVGKPLALELLKRGAFVGTFDIRNTPEDIRAFCQKSDYIFSGTGAVHLVNADFLSSKKEQILIDIGYGHKDGKPVGDIDFEVVKDQVLHITPVPWGIGPLTIASLFTNVFVLWEQK